MAGWTSFADFLVETESASAAERQALVDDLLRERPYWPWVEPDRATFVYTRMGTSSAAVNLDTIPADPPFDVMENLEGTSFWYTTRPFASDDLLDYMLAVNDPMTPLAEERDLVGRVSRHWLADPLNPLQMSTAQMRVSVLRMPQARPFADWEGMKRVPRGTVYQHMLDSEFVGFSQRKLWVYTPPGYEDAGAAYPLLVLQDGQWDVGPLQIPFIADALIKHNRLQPVVIAMMQSGNQSERVAEFISNTAYTDFMRKELIPLVSDNYRIDNTRIAAGGVATGAIASAHAALEHPELFFGLLMISPPMGKGMGQELLQQYPERFADAKSLPRRIFQSVGRYEVRSRFIRPAYRLSDVLSSRDDIAHRFIEVGSGHGLVAFRSVFPEALAWIFPGEAFG